MVGSHRRASCGAFSCLAEEGADRSRCNKAEGKEGADGGCAKGEGEKHLVHIAELGGEERIELWVEVSHVHSFDGARSLGQ